MKASIEISGLNEVVSNLKKLQDDLKLKGDELATRLGQLGVRIATMYYAQGVYAGYNDVEVTLDETGKLGTAKIVASGNAVLFIEFGTGITMPDAYEARAELKSGKVAEHGKYGQGYGADPNGWYYPATNGLGSNPPDGSEYADRNQTFIHTYGNPAFPAMYMTRNDLIDSIERIAREVFKL